MGIKNLKKFLRDTCPDCIEEINITQFQGEKIAIDISSYIYKYKAIFTDKWLNAFINLIFTFKKYNIHANFIFDGIPPKEKNREQEKRKNVKNNLEDDVMNISIELEKYKQTKTPTPLLISVMEKINKNNKSSVKINKFLYSSKVVSPPQENNDQIFIDERLILDYINKKEKQIINITSEDINNLKKLLSFFGVPYIQAPGEAEALASYMHLNDKVKAVLTEDTDVLAYGVNIFLSDFNVSSGTCMIISLNKVLDELELTKDEFLDFCIMCGTDYNDNIPNYACKKVYKIITEYKNIEKFIAGSGKNLDYKILNHTRSRELFLYFGDLINGQNYNSLFWEPDISFDNIREFCLNNNCYLPEDKLDLWKECELVFED